MLKRMSSKAFAELLKPLLPEVLRLYHNENLSLHEIVVRLDRSWITHKRLTMYVRRHKLRPAKRASPIYENHKRCAFTICGKKFIPSSWNQLYCKECMPVPRLSRRLFRKFGISQAKYDEMIAECGGRCLGCLQVMIHGAGSGTAGSKFRLNVDHCHITGKVRGLLCNNCNRSMGYLRDDPATLRRLADYLERAQA